MTVATILPPSIPAGRLASCCLLVVLLTPLAVSAQQTETPAKEADRAAAYYHFSLAHLNMQRAKEFGRPEYIQKALDEFGRIDLLINNAGVMSPGKLWEIPLKRWDLVNKVNVRGAVACCQAVLPHMIEHKQGVIINISSIAADQVGAANASYSVTKQALRKLSESLAGEVKAYNIQTFSLSPEGLVVTPGTMYHRLPERTPSGPFVEAPEAMGKAVIFLCRDEAKELTGQHFYSRALLREHGLWDEPAPPGMPG